MVSDTGPAAGGMIISNDHLAAVAPPVYLRAQISRGLARIRGDRPKTSDDSGSADS